MQGNFTDVHAPNDVIATPNRHLFYSPRGSLKDRRRIEGGEWGRDPLLVRLRALGSTVSSPAGSGAKPQLKTNLEHSGLEIWPL